MTNAALSQPIIFLRQAIAKALPNRAETVNIPFDGTLAQAWPAFARLLALTPAELAQAVAASYGVPPAGPVERKVMAFGPALTGHIMNNGDLNTGGDMREFTAEVAIVGGTQVAAAAGHSATILSYATRSTTNEFLIWNPSSLTIEFKNVDINTHVNVNDGQNHRLTTTWQSATGALILYDNGKEVWRGTVNQGGTIGGKYASSLSTLRSCG